MDFTTWEGCCKSFSCDGKLMITEAHLSHLLYFSFNPFCFALFFSFLSREVLAQYVYCNWLPQALTTFINHQNVN